MVKSNGHITLIYNGVELIEFYERPDGDVYRAPVSNVLDVDGFRLGRWECSRAHFDRFRDVITGWPSKESWAICPRCDGTGTHFLRGSYGGMLHKCIPCNIEFFG